MLIKKNRYLLILLSVYCTTQILIWFVWSFLQPILIIAQEFFYFVAIILSVMTIVKEIDQRIRRKAFFISLMAFLFFNFILLMFWIPTVQFNPEINWKLQGNLYEVDPWYYAIYIPIVNFLLASLITLLVFLIKSAIQSNWPSTRPRCVVKP
jgi:hypothetical protein